MDDLAKLEQSLGNIDAEMSPYTADLPSQINTEIQKAISPALERSLGQTSKIMGQGLPNMIQAATSGPWGGTTAADLSPGQKLSRMGSSLGSWTGDLQASQQLSDYLGGQMNDMYNNALQAAQLGYQGLSDKYARAYQQYQMKWQEAENAKNRAASGGGGTVINFPGGDEQTPTTTPNINPVHQQRLSEMEVYLRQLGNKAITKEERKASADSIIKSFVKISSGIQQYLTPEIMYNAYNLAGFSDSWNPANVQW